VVEVNQMDWITIAMDQIVNQVAKLRYIWGPGHGAARDPHGRRRGPGERRAALPEPGGLVRHVPGLYVVMPATPYDAKGC